MIDRLNTPPYFHCELKNKHPGVLLNKDLQFEGRTHAEGGQAVLSGLISPHDLNSLPSASLVTAQWPGQNRPEFCKEDLPALLLSPQLPGNPCLRYTNPDLGSGDKEVPRPSPLPSLGQSGHDGDLQMEAHNLGIHFDLEHSVYTGEWGARR